MVLQEVMLEVIKDLQPSCTIYFLLRVMSTLLGWLVTLMAFLASVEAYFVTVDAHAEECFFDKVTNHLKHCT